NAQFTPPAPAAAEPVREPAPEQNAAPEADRQQQPELQADLSRIAAKVADQQRRRPGADGVVDERCRRHDEVDRRHAPQCSVPMLHTTTPKKIRLRRDVRSASSPKGIPATP